MEITLTIKVKTEEKIGQDYLDAVAEAMVTWVQENRFIGSVEVTPSSDSGLRSFTTVILDSVINE